MPDLVPSRVIDFLARENRRHTKLASDLANEIVQVLTADKVDLPHFVEKSKELNTLGSIISWLTEVADDVHDSSNNRNTVAYFISSSSLYNIPDTQNARNIQRSIIILVSGV
jgi:hypothetical protein